jgi:Fe-S-cluster-containing dehydrogenase component
MISNRREFLTLFGLSAIGVFSPPLARIISAKTGQPPPQNIFPPAPGTAAALTAKRWGMAVDVRKCRDGCRDCIDACHLTHNVPDFGNPKDEIKWIWQEHFENVFPAENHPYLEETVKKRPMLVLCNHCDNPPCVRVCPTAATFKRADGIVMMDYHRCIGCKICLAACPYGARSINFRNPRPFIRKLNPDYPTRSKGVIEKCNFCDERLARGILPACVTACRDKALVFGDVDDPGSDVRRLLDRTFSLRRRAELGTKPQVYYIL